MPVGKKTTNDTKDIPAPEKDKKKSPRSVGPIVPKIQTAEGWKRSMTKAKKGPKKSGSS